MAANDNATDSGTDSQSDLAQTDEEILQKAQQMDAFPEAEDYDPQANHNAAIVGDSADDEDTWDDFGLALRPILHNGTDTGQRALLRNGEFIAMVSDQYKVLPHERLAVVTDEIAQDMGLVKWDQFGDEDDWYIKMDKHIIMDDDGRRMHALYAKPDPVDVDGDEIHMGIAVHNSIDGSLGFNVGLFTFRHACANMVWMGVNGEGMSFDDREVVANYSHKHTKGLTVEPDDLRLVMRGTLQFADPVHEAYEAWRDEYTTVDDAKTLLDRAQMGQLARDDLPEWLDNAREAIAEYGEQLDDDDPFPEPEREAIIRSNLPGTESRWETYNDMTESIWHSDDTQDTSKRRKKKAVHRAFDPGRTAKDVTIR